MDTVEAVNECCLVSYSGHQYAVPLGVDEGLDGLLESARRLQEVLAEQRAQIRHLQTAESVLRDQFKTFLIKEVSGV